MERLRELRVSRRREGGVKDATVLPDQAGIRRAITAQMCPFCERGPFKMLPVHTNKIHGVDKWQLRDMAGYTTADPLCAEETRAAMADAWNPDNLVKAQAALAHGRRRPRRTTAGAQKLNANLATWEAANPEAAAATKKAAAKRATTLDALARRSATLRARYAADPAAKERAIAHLQRPENRAKALEAAAKANRRPVPEHGDVNRYKHHGCRCDPCRAAKAVDRRKARTP